ncbi:retrovirus-related Pol polyprotein from type-1 retrotransposable element R2 [Caerostris extrusa]|uniref:Retrovirus-related Pol polyprotein from type-1 retrotransposable element R2 n=1 Tax=Caerostris extrusa TaxID=172846 RepID=A0AAV4W7I5_CAEEX|nr:retrovirus-related Pol polyprotein from type-1 retrotransposable element R2 [Caerostris extrusa]
MRTGQFKKTDWERVDRMLKKEVKATLNLPDGASNEYLFGNRKQGCIGLPIAAEESELNLIDTAFKLLTSSDDIVSHEALSSLAHTVSKRIRRTANDSDIEDYLSGSLDDDFSTTTNHISNIWTVARSASRRLGVTWEFQDGVPRLLFQDLTLRPNSRKRILHSIRDRLRSQRSQDLIAKKNQGKVMECVALSPSSSHFITDAKFTRFADWRFIHKARLNLVPLNGAQQWKTGNDRRCRRCPAADETLPHVLNHCKRASRAWQLRHNSIVARIKNAVSPKCEVLGENQDISGSGLRPDLFLKHQQNYYLVDVTVPFENRCTALQAAHQRKVDKYQPVLEVLMNQGIKATIIPFVVGALGTWNPPNDAFMRKFCSKSYLNPFRKLCVSDTIKWSRDIYIEHLTGHTTIFRRLYHLRYLRQHIEIDHQLFKFEKLEERPKFEPPWNKSKFEWRYMKQRKEGCYMYTVGSKMNGRMGCTIVSVFNNTEQHHETRRRSEEASCFASTALGRIAETLPWVSSGFFGMDARGCCCDSALTFRMPPQGAGRVLAYVQLDVVLVETIDELVDQVSCLSPVCPSRVISRTN